MLHAAGRGRPRSGSGHFTRSEAFSIHALAPQHSATSIEGCVHLNGNAGLEGGPDLMGAGGLRRGRGWCSRCRARAMVIYALIVTRGYL